VEKSVGVLKPSAFSVLSFLVEIPKMQRKNNIEEYL